MSRLSKVNVSMKPVTLGLLVLLAALTVRMTYLQQIRDNPFFDSPMIDARMYDVRALEISRGNLVGDHVYYQAPLYSVFLGGIYAIFGHDYYAARVVQLVLSAINCVLVFLLGRAVFGMAVGVLAGLMSALYGTFVFYDAELLRPVLIVFLLLATLLVIRHAALAPTQGYRWWAAAGLLLGLSVVTRETGLVLLPVALLWMVIAQQKQRPWRQMATAALVFCLATTAVIAPVTLRNWIVGGEFSLVSSQGGLNFFIGNNPDAAHTTTLQPGADWEEMTSRASREAGIWRAGQQSAWYYAQAFGFITEQPGQWLALMFRKLTTFWNAFEVDPNNDIDYFRERSLLGVLMVPGAYLIIPFGLLVPLGLVGMVLGGPRRRGVLLLLLAVLAYMGAVVLFHVRARYRLPVVPLLIVFAAWAVHWFYQAVSARRWRAVLPVSAVVVAAFWVVNADHYGIRSTPRMPIEYFVGQAYLHKGQAAKGASELERAVAKDPTNVNVHNSLGIAYQRTRRPSEAEDAYREAIRLRPGYRVPYNNLGHLYERAGRREQAAVLLVRALEIDPSYVEARNNLGIAYLNMGKLDSAEREFTSITTRYSRDHVAAHFNLGLTRVQQGKFREAASAFAQAARLDPTHTEARRGHEFALRQLSGGER